MFDYKKSRFLVDIPISNGHEDLLAVYHTLTQALFLIPAAQWADLEKTTWKEDPETIWQLSSQGVLIKTEVDETALFNQWRDRHVHDFSLMRSKVLVTRKCNNRCTYCIIEPQAVEMGTETAREMDSFYIEQIKSFRPLQVKDDYLGGEPLLNTDVVFESASRRCFYCRGKGLEYAFTITTNGTLLTRAIITKLKAVGLNGIRVSMAGPADVHDTLRPFRGGGGTYERIMQNMLRISGMIPISIECQYDAGSDDYQRMPEMMDDLLRRGIEVSEITFTPILARRRANSYCAGMGDVEKIVFLYRKSARRGYQAHTKAPCNTCMADFRSIFVFDADGSLIPCPSLQCGEMAIGDVRSGIDFVSECQILQRPLPEKCLIQCELLPVCMGGCRLQALTRNGNFNGVDCHYQTYRPLLEEYIYCAAVGLPEEQMQSA